MYDWFVVAIPSNHKNCFLDHGGAFIYDFFADIISAERNLAIVYEFDSNRSIHYQECGIVISGLVYLCFFGKLGVGVNAAGVNDPGSVTLFSIFSP
jgi:hypothetical protein